MTDIMKTELALASYVALRLDDWQPAHGCPAWIESRDSQCGKAPAEAVLCKRHKTVAGKRHQKAVEKLQQEKARRAEYRAKNLPAWKAELQKVEADMQRYGGALTSDRAAYGGAAHPSIRRHQLQQLSDTNVQRMAGLVRKAEDLRSKIGKD